MLDVASDPHFARVIGLCCEYAFEGFIEIIRIRSTGGEYRSVSYFYYYNPAGISKVNVEVHLWQELEKTNSDS